MSPCLVAAAASAALLLAPGALGGRTPVTGLDNYSPVWSPDGTRIAFTTRSTLESDVWVMNADATGIRKVTATEPFLHDNVTWSPDGKRIAFVRWDIGHGEPLPPAQIEVQTLDDGSSARAIAETDGPPTSLAWSSTDRIAYSDSGTIQTVSPAGTDAKPVGLGYGPAWSPSGDSLAFGRGSSLWRASADGSDERLLLTMPDGKLDGIAWAPDGSTLAFAHQAAGDRADTELWTIGADGSNPVRLVSRFNVSAPSWSPHGRVLAFSANAPTWEYAGDVFIVPARGGASRNVTHDNGAEENPRFSSSGRLAYDGPWDIFTIDADGRNRHNLTGTQSGLATVARRVKLPNRLVLGPIDAAVESPPAHFHGHMPMNLEVTVRDRRGDIVDGAVVSATPLMSYGLRYDAKASRPRSGKISRGVANLVFRRTDERIHTGTRLRFRFRITGGARGTGVDERRTLVVNRLSGTRGR